MNKLVEMVTLALQDEPEITNEIIEAALEKVEKIFPQEAADREQIIKELKSRFAVWMERDETVLQCDEDHIPWLHSKKSEIGWDFWKRYRYYIEINKGFAPKAADHIDRITDRILGFLEEPHRSGQWDRRGMVVGQVQSGKTSNYTGLICKAVDAGYKIVIVLAGMHKSLRSQTQIRLDEGFLGRDTRQNMNFSETSSRIGVGMIKIGDPIADALTNSADNGDFKTSAARNILYNIGGTPLLLVVKKNYRVLQNLLVWLENSIDKKGGSKTIQNIPLLLIDDEADNASIDGRSSRRDEYGIELQENDPTKINQLIRRLLKNFDKSSYVGYTATPFANIFIYPKDENTAEKPWGEDLFPRSFIINLPAPSNYIGPVEVFGISRETDDIYESKEPLPIVREINDYMEFMPDKHKISHQIPNEIPLSLDRAVKSFILSCAARIARGQDKVHNSMLIHVTRYTAVQNQVVSIIRDKITYIRRCFEYNTEPGGRSITEDFKNIWESDYAETTAKIMNMAADPIISVLEWQHIEPLLFKAVSRITVKEINGSAGDVLDYFSHKDGLNVIAVGGDKLSRGLTLEGLTVSYYLRASRMYDTLMQMGRWFGYRPGYLDLCRLYTSPELSEWYSFIAGASEELREEFNYMAEASATPEEFGLRVRNHPGVLQVTAANKIRHGTKMKGNRSRGI